MSQEWRETFARMECRKNVATRETSQERRGTSRECPRKVSRGVVWGVVRLRNGRIIMKGGLLERWRPEPRSDSPTIRPLYLFVTVDQDCR